MTDPTTPAPASDGTSVPVDFAAVLAAMQDQLDDLTTVVEAQQQRITALEQSRKG